MDTTSAKKLLTTREALDYLSISKPTLLRWARTHGIKRTLFGKAVRYPIAELDRLIKVRSQIIR